MIKVKGESPEFRHARKVYHTMKAHVSLYQNGVSRFERLLMRHALFILNKLAWRALARHIDKGEKDVS